MPRPLAETVLVQENAASPVKAAEAHLADVPGGSNLISSADIEKGRVGTTSDILAFQPGVFAQTAQGSDGLKLSIRGPGINQWDISLLKSTRIAEKVNLQFRFETFNTFNHTQWSGVNTGLNLPNPNTPVTAATRGTFGQVNSTRDPRTLQFGLKLLF